MNPQEPLATDLIAYLMCVMPDVDALRMIVPALMALVNEATIRIIDVVVLSSDDDGSVVTLELEAVEHLASLRSLDVEVGGMLSSHDIEMLSLALSPGTAAVVLVTEDRWAAALCDAVRTAGGHVLAGERIDASRVQAVLSEEMHDRERG